MKGIPNAFTFLFFIFILSFMLPSVSATTITIGDICSENEVTASIMLNDATDVATATVNVTYDPSVIVVTDVKRGDFQNFFKNDEHVEEGWVKIGGYQIGEGLSGNVKLAELTISPKGGYGEVSELDIDVETLSDGDYNPIDAEVKSGFFYIGKESDTQPSPEPTTSPTPTSPPSADETTIPASPSPAPSVNETIPPSPSPSPTEKHAIMTVHVQVGTVTVEKGETANASIMITGIGEEGLSCARITLNYDSSVVEVESVGGSEFDTFVENNVPSEGCLKMVAFQMGADPVRGDIKFAEIKMRAAGKVNKSSELPLEINELKDNEGRSVRFERKNGFFLITGEEETEVLSAAIWVWGVLGVVLLMVVIAGVCLHIVKKKRK